ncbi:hypothetical protein pb186bvf_011412 [Paramecium bursaria]
MNYLNGVLNQVLCSYKNLNIASQIYKNIQLIGIQFQKEYYLRSTGLYICMKTQNQLILMGCCTVKQQMKKNYEFQVIKIVFFEEILNIPALSFGETEEGIIFPQCLSSLRPIQQNPLIRVVNGILEVIFTRGCNEYGEPILTEQGHFNGLTRSSKIAKGKQIQNKSNNNQNQPNNKSTTNNNNYNNRNYDNKKSNMQWQKQQQQQQFYQQKRPQRQQQASEYQNSNFREHELQGTQQNSQTNYQKKYKNRNNNNNNNQMNRSEQNSRNDYKKPNQQYSEDSRSRSRSQSQNQQQNNTYNKQNVRFGYDNNQQNIKYQKKQSYQQEKKPNANSYMNVIQLINTLWRSILIGEQVNSMSLSSRIKRRIVEKPNLNSKQNPQAKNIKLEEAYPGQRPQTSKTKAAKTKKRTKITNYTSNTYHTDR